MCTPGPRPRRAAQVLAYRRWNYAFFAFKSLEIRSPTGLDPDLLDLTYSAHACCFRRVSSARSCRTGPAVSTASERATMATSGRASPTMANPNAPMPVFSQVCACSLLSHPLAAKPFQAPDGSGSGSGHGRPHWDASVTPQCRCRCCCSVLYNANDAVVLVYAVCVHSWSTNSRFHSITD